MGQVTPRPESTDEFAQVPKNDRIAAMSTSAPSDLAVAFRSLPRRLRQATGDDAPPAAVALAANAVQAAFASAAAMLKCSETSDAIGLAIEQRRVDDWTDADLAELQTIAQTAAKQVRHLEDLRREEE